MRQHLTTPLLICTLIVSFTAIRCIPSTKKDSGNSKPQASSGQFTLDDASYSRQLSFFTDEPHPFGSERQSEVADFIASELTILGAAPQKQMFESSTPNTAVESNPNAELTTTKTGTNPWLRLKLTDQPTCLVVIGSHYDTKIVNGIDYVGANDSASSSILLLHLARHIRANTPSFSGQCDALLIWFDGEESVLPNWSDGIVNHPAKQVDHTYGSRHFVANLDANCALGTHCFPVLPTDDTLPIRSAVIVDMIGSPNMVLTPGTLASPELYEALERAVVSVGEEGRLKDVAQAIEDDHVPFLQAGIPAIDLIDFENVTHWHRSSDTSGRLSTESIEAAGRIVIAMLHELIE